MIKEMLLNLQNSTKKNVSNPYLVTEAVDYFEKSTYIPKESFYEMGIFLLKYLNINEKNKILDTGTGTGRSIFNIAEAFNQAGYDYSLECFDISKKMIEKFEDNLRNYPILDVIYYLYDANVGTKYTDNIDLAIFISVLHYFNWESFLQSLNCRMKINSVIVIAELNGWYKMLDGEFDFIHEDNNPLSDVSREFWQQYFLFRNELSSWTPEVKFSNISKVDKFLVNQMKYSFVEKVGFSWINNISWDDVINWIKKGSVSSLGSDLSKENKVLLATKMSEFLCDKSIKENVTFNIQWGVNLYVYRKE